MNDVVVSRTPAIIAAEINSIKEQTRIQVLCNSIEIGRKLCEAKELVEHGEWGDWLKNEVEYSKSTANNLMKIFKEYGSDQISLIGENVKSQAFGSLTYTQAIALIGIKDVEEREKFVQENNIDEMSTRELKKAIEDKKKAEEDAKKAKQELEKFKSKSKEEQERIKKLENENKKLTETMTRESDKIISQLDSKEKEVLEARKEIEEYKAKIKEFEEKPVEVITAEPDDEKIKDLEEKHQKEIAELKDKLSEAEKKLKDAESSKGNSESEEVLSFKLHFNQIVADFKNILIDVNNIKKTGEDGEKYQEACRKFLNTMMERL